MKKYTKRLKQNFHNWRVFKNWVLAAITVGVGVNTVVLHGGLFPVIAALLINTFLVTVGETMYYIAMSWVETAESIQDRNETI